MPGKTCGFVEEFLVAIAGDRGTVGRLVGVVVSMASSSNRRTCFPAW